MPTVLDSATIDNQNGSSITTFGDLQDFMTPAAYATVTNALEGVCRDCHIKAVKIFPGHLTTFTSTTSRLGETIAVPDFWTALLLVFPNNASIPQVCGIFNNLPSVAAYAHPNLMAELYSVPNDSLFQQQRSICNNTLYPNAHVNAEEAWDVQPNGGKSYIRGGIFDVGVDWEHHEFNYNGSNPNTSKIIDGYSWSAQAKTKTLPHGGCYDNLHATAIAGIIGAQRNNGRGVAGIAGGNDSTGSKGVSLYDLTLWDPGGGAWLLNLAPMNYLSNAIFFSTQNPSSTNSQHQNYTFGLNFQNHSWGLRTPPADTGFYAFHNQSINIITEVMHKINRVGTTAIAARGNNTGTTTSFPANVDDDWVINVTGTGIDGQFGHIAPWPGQNNSESTSAWGGDVDIAAPNSGSLITTLSTPGATLNGQGSMYNTFGGTSASAPHVSGAVALMMSHINDSTAAYKNMAPEDCEAIIQLSATDTDTSGWDQLTGHGRLNIGKAMKLIQKPWHTLYHFGQSTQSQSTNMVTKTLYSASNTVTLTEAVQRPITGQWLQKGKYVVKTYEITTTVNHNIFNLDTIIAFWPRSSSSVTWPLFNNGKLTPREKTKITALNMSSATLKGYLYEVKDSTGTNSLGWWPVDTSYVPVNNLIGWWAEYSVLTKNFGNPVGLEEKGHDSKGISIYPNPTSGSQTLIVETDKICDLTIDLYDLMGRKIKTVYSGKTNERATAVSHNVQDLPNSLYIYTITIDGATSSSKFIKQ
ncbi:MAG: S8 family peptidase [bacterium]|nr:S8 family peptidase [bacterium]